jgi:hypothetical protein
MPYPYFSLRAHSLSRLSNIWSAHSIQPTPLIGGECISTKFRTRLESVRCSWTGGHFFVFCEENLV